MRNPQFHQTEGQSPAPTARRRSRRLALVGAGALALVLATVGSVAALGGGPSSPATQAQERTTTPATVSPVSTSPRAKTASKAAGKPASLAATPVLADGTYPTYINKVDIDGARITVDVIQVFQGQAAIDAAVEDGTSASEAQYLYVYVRNQNPRLRTLPVAGELRIVLLHECESPPQPPPTLADLASKTTPFNKLYYYDITVRDGAIQEITEHLTDAAC